MKKLILLLTFIITSCAGPIDPYDLGIVQKLPKGEYIIRNTGSRHMLKCTNIKGQSYWINDNNLGLNGIPGRDAHEYRNPTKITIK